MAGTSPAMTGERTASHSSCPRLSRASTSLFLFGRKTWKAPEVGLARLPHKLRTAMPGQDADRTLRPSIAQVLLTLAQPRLLIRLDQRLQVLRLRRLVIDPFPQQGAAVDDVDSEPVVLILVGEIAPQ